MAELLELVLYLLAAIASSDDKKDSGWHWIPFLLVLFLGLFGIAFGWLLSR